MFQVTRKKQVHNYRILSKNTNLHNYYPKTEHLIIGSCGPLGLRLRVKESSRAECTGLGVSLRLCMVVLACIGCLLGPLRRERERERD